MELTMFRVVLVASVKNNSSLGIRMIQFLFSTTYCGPQIERLSREEEGIIGTCGMKLTW